MAPAAVVACQIVSARFRAGPSGLVVVSSDSAVGELGITTGGTSKLVDRIEAGGYGRRLPNPQDRRSSLLELAPEGRRLFGEAAEAFDDELRRRLSTRCRSGRFGSSRPPSRPCGRPAAAPGWRSLRSQAGTAQAPNRVPARHLD